MWLRRELVAEGYDDRAIARMVQGKVLSKVRRGAYVDAATFAGLDEAGRYGMLTRAVLKQAKTAVVASHTSAVPEYHGSLWGLDLSTTHVTRRDGKAGRREAGVQQHCGEIREGDVVRRNGIWVMDATRAALEVTTVAGVEASLGFVNHLLHVGETTQAALDERCAQMGSWPHTLTTDLVLRLADPRIESLGETRTFYLCYRQGIPMPQPQVEICDEFGQVVARVDFAWPEHRVYLEFDGKIKYEKLLRPGESASDVVFREKRREDMIHELTGWRCIRITWADLMYPVASAARIREVLGLSAA